MSGTEGKFGDYVTKEPNDLGERCAQRDCRELATSRHNGFDGQVDPPSPWLCDGHYVEWLEYALGSAREDRDVAQRNHGILAADVRKMRTVWDLASKPGAGHYDSFSPEAEALREVLEA